MGFFVPAFCFWKDAWKGLIAAALQLPAAGLHLVEPGG